MRLCVKLILFYDSFSLICSIYPCCTRCVALLCWNPIGNDFCVSIMNKLVTCFCSIMRSSPPSLCFLTQFQMPRALESFCNAPFWVSQCLIHYQNPMSPLLLPWLFRRAWIAEITCVHSCPASKFCHWPPLLLETPLSRTLRSRGMPATVLSLRWSVSCALFFHFPCSAGPCRRYPVSSVWRV